MSRDANVSGHGALEAMGARSNIAVLERLTRRAFIVRTAGLAVGVAGLSMVRPASALAQGRVQDQDLEDKGEAFRRSTARGVAVVPTPGGPAVQATENGGVFTSAALQSSIRFTHVGFHWSAAIPAIAALSFEVRTSADGATWSSWSAVPVERLPDETPVADYFGSLIYAGGARFVQYRAAFRTVGGASPMLRRVTATVIDSPVPATTDDQLATLSVSDAASGRRVAVTSREQWEADESMRFSRRGSEVWPEMFIPSKKLVVHHTATRNDYATGAEAAAEVRAIYRYHAVTQRWGDIGYNALIDKFGNRYEGSHGRREGDARTGGREALSACVVAGHDYHHNYGSSGIALLGDATKADWPMKSASGVMWDALVACWTFDAGRHFLRPLQAGATTSTPAASELLRSDDLWTNSMRNFSGHRETNATACPGDPVMALLGNLRGAIQANLTESRKAGVAISGEGREATLSTGLALTFSWAVQELPEG